MEIMMDVLTRRILRKIRRWFLRVRPLRSRCPSWSPSSSLRRSLWRFL
jgi:hypothetical protein